MFHATFLTNLRRQLVYNNDRINHAFSEQDALQEVEMKRIVRILVLVAVTLASIAVSSGNDYMAGNPAAGTALVGDKIKVYCETTGSHYKATIDYSAKKSRLILMAVIDVHGDGRRVYRSLVKAGVGTLHWSARKSRFKRLARGCVAMHRTSGDRATIASDCDTF